MNDSVFSANQKPSEKIRLLQKLAGGVFTRYLFAGKEDEPLYMLKPHVIDILIWTNKNILFELPRVKNCSNTQWIGVRIRIATNMLNKCVENNFIEKDTAIAYHGRLTSRIRRILGDIYTEDLPF